MSKIYKIFHVFVDKWILRINEQEVNVYFILYDERFIYRWEEDIAIGIMEIWRFFEFWSTPGEPIFTFLAEFADGSGLAGITVFSTEILVGIT